MGLTRGISRHFFGGTGNTDQVKFFRSLDTHLIEMMKAALSGSQVKKAWCPQQSVSWDPSSVIPQGLFGASSRGDQKLGGNI